MIHDRIHAQYVSEFERLQATPGLGDRLDHGQIAGADVREITDHDSH